MIAVHFFMLQNSQRLVDTLLLVIWWCKTWARFRLQLLLFVKKHINRTHYTLTWEWHGYLTTKPNMHTPTV